MREDEREKGERESSLPTIGWDENRLWQRLHSYDLAATYFSLPVSITDSPPPLVKTLLRSLDRLDELPPVSVATGKRVDKGPGFVYMALETANLAARRERSDS